MLVLRAGNDWYDENGYPTLMSRMSRWTASDACAASANYIPHDSSRLAAGEATGREATAIENGPQRGPFLMVEETMLGSNFSPFSAEMAGARR